uniref:Uncharacterized protein n=1 Tax=Catharus ustulatus TaxID=91951 RepID=A0A8C3UCT2_CATUS
MWNPGMRQILVLSSVMRLVQVKCRGKCPLALVAIPACIGALGLTGTDIAAGSIAAKMMSAAAIANGGGVAAGSTVAVLQSVGEWGGQGSWASSPCQGTLDCILGLL